MPENFASITGAWFAAISDIIGYIELYYNQIRIQKGLGYKSPRQVWFDFYRQAA